MGILQAGEPDEHPTIKTKCKNFNGSTSSGCKGCKWYPEEKYTRINDCRGFTYGILKAVYGWELIGAGATSQWNTESNWSAKGGIGTLPKDTLVCLFVKDGNKMSHTGLGYKGETVECYSGVQHFTTTNKKWTHWGVPVCVKAEPVPIPEGSAVVTGKRVALRKAPATSAGEIIMRVNTGQTVKILDPPPPEWDYVEYGGKKGWMMRKYLDEGEKK